MTARPSTQPATLLPPDIRLERRWWHELPRWAFYIPVGIAILGLLIRHRSLNAPLCADYGLKNGGLFPRSKAEFFALFDKDTPLLPKQASLDASLPADPALARYTDFMEGLPKTARTVLKPDDGIQGMAVHMIGDAEDFARCWKETSAAPGAWLLQEFVGGFEAGAFYVREDPARPGRIVSLTYKRGFAVTGDGEATVGRLIERADADGETMRRVAKYNRDRLAEVPGKGVELDLMPVRNHHLGATFQDISAFITPELDRALAPHLDAIEGYHYGRLDLRAPDFAALRAGKGIKILEANALYSEPVHAYDPRYGFGEALSIFIQHWHAAIRAGLANKRAGRPQVSAGRVIFPEK